jgi:hypothetical protein
MTDVFVHIFGNDCVAEIRIGFFSFFIIPCYMRQEVIDYLVPFFRLCEFNNLWSVEIRNYIVAIINSFANPSMIALTRVSKRTVSGG